jgi:hypothetical protein
VRCEIQENRPAGHWRPKADLIPDVDARTLIINLLLGDTRLLQVRADVNAGCFCLRAGEPRHAPCGAWKGAETLDLEIGVSAYHLGSVARRGRQALFDGSKLPLMSHASGPISFWHIAWWGRVRSQVSLMPREILDLKLSCWVRSANLKLSAVSKLSGFVRARPASIQ